MRTIKQRLTILSLMIIAVSGATLGLALHGQQKLHETDATRLFKLDRVLTASEANDALMGLRLNAMDALVDYDSAAIAPDLEKEFTENQARFLDRFKKLNEQADDNEERALIQSMQVLIDKLLPAIDGLKKAIVQQSGHESMAQFDDVIDDTGNQVSGMMNKLRDGLNKEYADSKDDLDVVFAESNTRQIALLGGSAVLFTLVIIAFSRSLLSSLRRLGNAMAELARGNLNTEVPGLDQKNEIGAMAQHVQFFKTSLIEQERMREEQEQAKHMAEMEKKRSMHKMADEFEVAVLGIVNTVATSSVQMKDFAESLTKTAEEASQRATSVAAASEEAAANVSTVAAATEELSSSISEISRQVADSSKTAASAVDEARSTNTTVNTMATAANKIGEVVQLISEIANQTNLLALNATIEAARAGEAGKGFAVVASEVKNLASQTAKATEDITVQISGIQGVAGDAVKAIQGIGGTIERINSISTAIAAAVEEQGAATAEISRNVQSAAAGTKEVSDNITGVTMAASETGQVAAQVLDSASELERESNRLKAEVQKFIQTVRAA